MIDLEKQRELAKLLEGEGFPPDQALEIAADGMVRYPDEVDEMIKNLRNEAELRRKRLS